MIKLILFGLLALAIIISILHLPAFIISLYFQYKQIAHTIKLQEEKDELELLKQKEEIIDQIVKKPFPQFEKKL